MIFGLSDRLSVDKLFIHGVMKVNGGKVLGINEEKIYSEARNSAKALWNRIIGG